MPSSWLCARCGGLCHRRVLTMKWRKGRKLDLCINCAELVEAVVFNGKLKALKGEEVIRETLRYSDYDLSEYRQSLIDPEGTVFVEGGMRCPRCKTGQARLEHNESRVCQCGLHMVRHGNALECSVTPPQAEP